MKAIVVETRGKEAAILLKDGTFRTVKGIYSVGETIDYREKARPAFRKWMAAAAAAVIMIGTGGGFWYDANYVAYAEISLDVNPSIVYTVNKRSRVLSVRAVNDEAAQTVSALEEEGIRFMPVAEAIDRTMTLFENEGYLDAEKEDYVLMNVSTDHAGIQERVISEIENGMGRAMERDPSMEYRVDHSDCATARRAEESDMSTGRYAVWEQEGSGRKQEDYAEMPVRELMGKPDEGSPENREEDSAPQTDDPAIPEVGMRRQDDPVLQGQQPAAIPDPQNGSGQQSEPDAPFAEPERNNIQGTEPNEPGKQQEESDETSKQPRWRSVDAEMSGEHHPGIEGQQPETGTEPPFQEAASDMRQDGDRQDLSLPSNKDGKSNNSITQGNPGNAPDKPGNLPAK